MEPISPVLISSGNCEAVCGLPWRHIRDHAAELGIEIFRIGRKHAVRSADLLAALDRRRPLTDPIDPADAAQRIRDRLGLVRR